MVASEWTVIVAISHRIVEKTQRVRSISTRLVPKIAFQMKTTCRAKVGLQRSAAGHCGAGRRRPRYDNITLYVWTQRPRSVVSSAICWAGRAVLFDTSDGRDGAIKSLIITTRPAAVFSSIRFSSGPVHFAFISRFTRAREKRRRKTRIEQRVAEWVHPRPFALRGARGPFEKRFGSFFFQFFCVRSRANARQSCTKSINSYIIYTRIIIVWCIITLSLMHIKGGQNKYVRESASSISTMIKRHISIFKIV